MIDKKKLDEELTGLEADVAAHGSVVDSIDAILDASEARTIAAVEAALNADNAADQDSIDVAVEAIQSVRAEFKTIAKKLADAAIANTPVAPPDTDPGAGPVNPNPPVNV